MPQLCSGWACVAIVSASAAVPLPTVAAVPSFSGADGAGSAATGGRGGDVYHVTLIDQNFNDVRPGTLRYGLTTAPATGRTIVFDVSGTFKLDKPETSTYTFDGNGWNGGQGRYNLGSNITIAGQTAPGPVNLMGGQMKAGGTNAILRNITIAPGYGRQNFRQTNDAPVANDFPDSHVFDAIDISGTNLMIDHVTAVYATDEAISANELANNITLQYSNVSQGQNYPQGDAEGGGFSGHAYGSLLQAGSNAKISVHHNLYAHQKGRLPRVGSEVGTGAHNDFRNNVFYNWLGTGGTGASAQASFNKFVGNFWRAGNGGDNAVGGTNPGITTSAGGTAIFNGSNTAGTRIFHAGNLKDVNKDGTANFNVALANGDFGSSTFVSDGSFSVPYFGVTDTAAAAYERVLNHVGARWWDRSAVDQRIVNEVRTGTGKIMAWADDPFNASPTEGVEWRNLVNTPTVARPANFDTDRDGMPDAWEAKHGTNPVIADNNGDFDSDEYTNLEEYINELAEWPAPAAIEFKEGTNARYSQITNWNVAAAATNTGTTSTAYWQPSKFDTAVIRAGAVTVDSAGSHAGVLQVGGAIGATATLNVTGGWLELAQGLDVGITAGGTGQVVQTGGLVIARDSVNIGAAATSMGVYKLQGGSLVTPLLQKSVGSTFEFTGGTLSAGKINFTLVNNGGTLAPGNSIGNTSIDGDLVLNGGSVRLELFEVLSDTIGVDGTATIGGSLDVVLLNNFAPAPGDFWQFLIADGGITGRFTSVTPGFEVIYANNVLTLTAVPEPATAGLLALGTAILLQRRQRRMNA